MDFEKRKAATLSSLSSVEADKSPKGSLDAPIIPLLNTLVSTLPVHALAESLSFRNLYRTPPMMRKNPRKKLEEVLGSSSPTTLPILIQSSASFSPPSQPHLLFQLSCRNFRFEPLIIAFECKELSSAQSLVSLAISCVFRESGITNANKRVIIAIRCSIRLEVPLGDTHKIMVPPEYVRYLVEVANEKMEVNRKRTKRFFGFFHSNGFVGSMAADNGDNMSINESLNPIFRARRRSCL